MERVHSIDFIKFFAIFAVVIIHAFPADSELGITLSTLSRFAVPFFFAASGYLSGQKLLNGSNSFSYVKNYIIKISKIYGCWLIFYFIYDIGSQTLYNILIGVDVKQEILKYLSSFTFMKLLYYGTVTSGYQLWFLPALIWSTLLVALFHKIKRIEVLLVLSLLLNLIGLFGQAYSGVWTIEIPFVTRDALFFGLFYTTLGFIFAKYYESIKLVLTKKTYISLIIGFFILQNVERYLLDSPGNYFLSTILLTACLFMFILNNKTLGQKTVFSKVGAQSLGIYVIHVFFIITLNLIFNLMDIAAITDSIIFRIFYVPFIFIISYFAHSGIQSAKLLIFKPTTNKDTNSLNPVKTI